MEGREKTVNFCEPALCTKPTSYGCDTRAKRYRRNRTVIVGVDRGQ